MAKKKKSKVETTQYSTQGISQEVGQWSLKHRPTKLEDMVGQGNLNIEGLVRNSQALLITGTSGSGKTTLSRILAREIQGKPSSVNRLEVDCGTDTGVGKVRELSSNLRFRPIDKKWVVIFDEVHKLTQSAFSSLLKLLEDPPTNKCVFILCTDQPWKLPRPVINRCRSVQIQEPTVTDTAKLLYRVAKKEGYGTVKNLKEIAKAVANQTEGIPRMALQSMQNVLEAAAGETRIDLSKYKEVMAVETEEIDQVVGQTLIVLYSRDASVDKSVKHLMGLLHGCDAYGVLMRLTSANHFGGVYHLNETFDWRSKVFADAVLKGKKLNPTPSEITMVTTRLTQLRKFITELSVDPVITVTSEICQLVIDLRRQFGVTKTKSKSKD